MIGKVIKDFKIIRQIGEGAMNNVYLAENSYGVLTVIKTAKQYITNRAEAINRLKQERMILQLLAGHPNIVQLNDYAEDEDGVYLFLEYVRDACTLSEYQHRCDLDLPSEKTLRRWLSDILSALNFMHNVNPHIIHCDIKPTNIMVTRFGEVKLIDFSIAQMHMNDTSPNLELPHEIKVYDEEAPRTVVYYNSMREPHISPEALVSPFMLNERTDIYMLGKTMEELLEFATYPQNKRGHTFYLGSLHKSREFELRSSRIHNFISKATQEQPSQRWQSCREIAETMNIDISTWSKEYTKSAPIANNTDRAEEETLYQDIVNLAKNTLSKISNLDINCCFYKKDFSLINNLWAGICKIEHAFKLDYSDYYVISMSGDYYIISSLFDPNPALIGGKSYSYISDLKNAHNWPNGIFNYVVVKIGDYFEYLHMPLGYKSDYDLKCQSEKEVDTTIACWT